MTISEKKIAEVGRRAQETGNLIWSVANTLAGPFKPHEYGLVILPMCVIKRFNDCLLPTHQAVLEANEKYKMFPSQLRAGFLKTAAGYQFYNTSRFTFSSLTTDPENIADNFEDYINGFSDNVQLILSRMSFQANVDRMNEAGLLYQVITDFNAKNLDMSPDHISTVDMGYIFEYLVQKFSESYNEEAGAHFTSRDIIYLMCDLLLTNGGLESSPDGLHCTVYDMTMGTSQMLTCMEERIKMLDANADVTTFGQEINPFTMGIAVADTMIHGGDPDNMQFGDTLSDDKFPGYEFDYVISNPPFGIDWKREATAVESEFKKGEEGRFGAGLPAKSDGQMLFLQNGMAKLKDTGKMAIIQNGSSLYTGDAGSGSSNIRKKIIEEDWLDAIVKLPTNSFYNTGISTYIWLISKKKEKSHLGKILLIDASDCYSNRVPSIGNKRVDITAQCSALIVKAYGSYVTADYNGTAEDGRKFICRCRRLNNDELGYNKIVVETPLRDNNGKLIKRKGKLVADPEKRDTDNVPLTEDIHDFFDREIRPYNPDGWIDEKKTKVGYEIPFTRTFFEFGEQRSSDEIMQEVHELKDSLDAALNEVVS